MNKLLNHYFNLENKKQTFILFLIFICAVTLVSLIHSFIFITQNHYLIDNNFNLILKRIPFNWGPLAQNIYENFEFNQSGYGFIFYLKKFPLNALLLASLFYISKNIYIFMLIKNIIISTVIFFTFYFFSKKNHKNVLFFLILLCTIFIIPYNTFVIFNFVYADHLTSFLIPLLFLCLINDLNKNYILIGLLIFTLYFTKPSMFFVCLIIPFIIILLDNEKNFFKKLIPLLFLISAILTWGFYGLSKTGVFPFGKNLLTNNSYNFSAVANKKFNKFYPDRGVDELVNNESTNSFLSSINFKNEWEYYNYFDEKNKTYLKENFKEYLVTIHKKIYFIFFRIKQGNISSYEFQNIGNKIRYSNIINKLILNISFVLSLYVLIKNYKNFLNHKLEIYYLSLLFLNLLPHLYAWATNKHLVGIFILSNIYLFLKIDLAKNFFTKL